MNSNIYWPIYKNIETEFNNLMFNIHIDDNQLQVYSSKISDLILRASTEIESLSKELYKQNGGTKTGNIKYDEDALSHLNSIWHLEQKKVIISSYNCFTTNKEILPFIKNEKRTGTSRLTYSWNNSYQNLKHDRANTLSFGSIKYLIDVTSSLFLLNIYYKDDKIDLKDDSNGLNFDNSLGSTIYSVKLHVSSSISIDKQYDKSVYFDECVYLLKPTDDTKLKVQEALKKVNDETADRIRTQAMQEITEKTKGLTDQNQIQSTINTIVRKVKAENEFAISRENANLLSNTSKNLKYEAILNKNQY